MLTLCVCKAVGVPEPKYGTDGLFVWITFKRPYSNTNSDTYSDTYSNTNSDTYSDTNLNTNLDTNLDTNSDTYSDTYSDTNLDTNLVTNSDGRLFLSDRQKEVLFYCISPRSSCEILNHINVTYHNKNIAKYITSLVDAGLLERTQPESPNSPNQKYVLKRSKNG